MPSSYPGGVDSFTTHQDDVNELIRAADINKIQDAVRAIEIELGLNPHGASADVTARLATLLSAATAASTYVPLTGSATVAGQKDFTTLPTFNGTPLGGALNERGTWVTSIAYAVGDIVNDTTNGQRYVCKAAHTSTTFSSDLSGGKWTTSGPSKNYVDTSVAGTAQRLIQTATKTANYTAVVKDLVPVDCTSGSVVITLPTGAAVGDAVAIRRADASANAVTVTAGGSDNIASGTTTVTSTIITLQDSVQVFVYSGSGQWTVAGGHRSLAALDGRFLLQTARAATNGVASLDGSTLVPTAQLATGSADNTKVLQGDRTWAAAVKLATSGQTPAQEPVVSAATANVGTLAYAARADHIHPFCQGPGASWFFGAPPNYNVDLTLDGSGGATPTISNPVQRMSINPVQRSGTVWTVINNQHELVFRNLTIAAGYTLKSTGPGSGLMIRCTGTLTIAGTLQVDGESPAAGAAPTQPTSSAGWQGFGGGTGATGAGATAPGVNTVYGVGGAGGSGGASGGTGGGGSGNHYSAYGGYGLDGELFLLGHGFRSSQNQSIAGTAAGGLGGGAGGGDGTNKGGSGGGGGGCLIVIAKNIVIASTGIISANGGLGAPGASGNAGGGGGGGGGVVLIHTLGISMASGGVIRANGGSGGAGVGTGSSGTSGGQSGVLSDPSAAAWGFAGLGSGISVNVWQ